MNTKAILGISLGAVFAIGMISMGMANFAIANESPDYMTFTVNHNGTVLKDHAAGKNPANNPAHWELIANVTGNMTQISADYNATGVAFGAIGIGILNNSTDVVYAVTIHNDTDSSAAAFEPHGHKVPILTQTNTQCENGLWLDLGSAEEIGEVKLEVFNGIGENYTIIEFDDIPYTEWLQGEENVCDDTTVNGTKTYPFHIGMNGTNVCAYLNDADGVNTNQSDGPDKSNKDKPNNKNWPTRVGGFEDNDPTDNYYQCSS